MKKLAIILAVAAVAVAAVLFAVPSRAVSQNDHKGLELTSLWKEFDEACSQDRPRKQLEILEQIVSESSVKKYPWDFYLASRYRVDVRSSINWKERTEARDQFKEAVEAYGLEVMMFHYLYENESRDAAYSYAKKNAKALKSTNVTQFREATFGDWDGLRTYVCGLCRNDYEYALWALGLNTKTGREELEKEVAGRYPDAAILEYLQASDIYNQDKRRETLSNLVEQYSGKAVSMLPKQALLRMEFSDLMVAGASSEQYLAFRDKCRAFEKERKGFSGEEKRLADVCDEIGNVLQNLEAHSASVKIQDGEMTLVLRNLDKLKVSIRTDNNLKTNVYKNTVVNEKNSFYVYDTVVVSLPPMNDGDYVVEYSGTEVESEVSYRKTTLSVSNRQDSNGWSIYAADYKSGKPVSKVDITLYNEDKETASVKGVSLNGFTPVPSSLVSKYAKYSNMIMCSYTDDEGIYHRTQKVYVDKEAYVQPEAREWSYACVFLDRAAFNPGETVSFKAVLYTQKGTEYKTAPEGRKLTAVLTDTQGKECASIDLKTNSFGSVHGSFNLPTGSRNGIFTISVKEGKNERGSANLRVDEFVLPSFNVTFDKADKLYIEGDDVHIKGYAKSYSGHSVASATVYACVSEGWRNVSREELEPVTVAADGSFEVVAKSVKEGMHHVTVKVVDNTGETLEFGTTFNVYDNVPVGMTILNTADASCANVVTDESMDIRFVIADENIVKGNKADISIVWMLMSDDKTVAVGSAVPGGTCSISLAGLPSGTYTLKSEATTQDASGKPVSGKTSTSVYKISDTDKVFNSDLENLFRVVENDGISVQFAAGRGPVWACVEIFGAGNTLLRSEMVHLDGVRGQEGSVKLLTYGFSKTWSDIVTLNVFYFRNGSSYTYSHEFRRNTKLGALPIRISRFSDVTSPASEYRITIDSEAGTEGLVSIFDKSTETIMGNWWNCVSLSEDAAPHVYYRRDCGSDETGYDYGIMCDYSGVKKVARATKALFSNARVDDVVYESAMVDCVEEESCAQSAAGDMEVAVRENFANTLAFEPCLKADASGRMTMSFKTSDKLSTYVIQAFAHNKVMRNSLTREEFKVTIPVKLSIMEPQILYTGDRYVVKANLSSTCDSKVSGRVAMYLYNTENHKQAKPIASYSSQVTVDAGSATAVEIPVDVPSVDVLGVKLVFTGVAEGNSISDAVFVSIPVRKASQTITEAHSSILLNGQDREALIADLRSRFVNIPAASAELKEITILDMVKAALPAKVTPKWKDVLSMVDALYASSLTSSLAGGCEVPDSLVAKVMECRNSDGGFGWFSGMSSSPQMTAMVLGRAASLRSRGLTLGLSDETLEEAVRFLDKQQFSTDDRPMWCGGISDYQYLYIRAQYASVKLAARPDSKFKKETKAYLVPSGKRGFNGEILSKARRLRTLVLLSSSEEGIALAKSLGVRLSASKKLRNSLEADEASLLEYAVDHKSGGKYYPNAVMPFRGLMESELYAHSLLCDLFRDLGDDEVAEGIRIWIMVQKETQQWESDPAYIEAIASVMDGSDAVKNTAVIILSGTRDIPFNDVKAAGNGFTVEVSYVNEKGEAVKDGDILHVGDRITAVCRIWNEENRSFVHAVVPRPASLRPVNQLSGYMGWWMNPISVGGWRSFSPQGYRNVRAGETEYFFDSYPEEKTEIRESFHVTQEGAFAAPAVTIESLYAPHYRANGSTRGVLLSE